MESVRQNGSASLGLIMSILAICFIAIFAISGCAPNQTASRQIAAQTDDPVIMAKAAYLDALTVYNEVLKSYLPYKTIAEESNPVAAATIKTRFLEANAMLEQMKSSMATGDIDKMNREGFRDYMRSLSIEIAKQAERGN